MLDNRRGRDETATLALFVLFELVAWVLRSPHRFLLEVQETIIESLSACYLTVIQSGNNAAQEQPGALGIPPYTFPLLSPHKGTSPSLTNYTSTRDSTERDQSIRSSIALTASFCLLGNMCE
jgi:hypothetical protein